MPDGVTPALVDTPYRSVARPRHYVRCTPWKTSVPPALSLQYPAQSRTLYLDDLQEFEESDITGTEGVCDVIEESMDTEMARQVHVMLMITNDWEKLWLDALVKEQDCEAVRQVKE